MSQLHPDPFTENPALRRLSQQQQLILERGDFFQEPEEDQEGVGLGQTIGAVGRTSMLGAMLRGTERAAELSAKAQAGALGARINPYEQLQKINAFQEKLYDEGRTDQVPYMQLPAFRDAVDRGHFDGSTTMEALRFDIETALLYQDAAEVRARSTWTQAGIAWTTVMLGDPVNLLPGGVAIKAAQKFKNLSTASRIGIASSLSGAGMLTLEKVQNAIQPYTNEPGLANELFATAMGGAMGSVFSGMAIGVMPKVRLSMGTRKIKRMREMTNEMMHVKAPTGVDNELADLTWQIQDSLENARRHLDDLDPVDNQVLTILRTEESKPIIKRLQDKYEQAGKSLHLVEHPAQRLHDDIQFMRQFTDASDNALQAGSRDLDANALDTAYQAISKSYVNLQDRALLGFGTNPEARLNQLAVAKIAQIHRVLSGSAQSLSKGNARDPMAFNAGTSADGLKLVQTSLKDQLVRRTRDIIKQARREGRTIEYNGEAYQTGLFSLTEHGRIRDAIGDYLSRRHTASHFNGEGALPDDMVDPLIRKAADDVQDHFREQLKLLDEVGMLDRGPSALKRQEAKLAQAEAAYERAMQRLDDATARHPIPDTIKQEGLSDAEALARLQRTIAAEEKERGGMVDRLADSSDELSPAQRDTIARAARDGDPRAEFSSKQLRTDLIQWAESTGFDPGMKLDDLMQPFGKPMAFGGDIPRELLDQFDTFGARELLRRKVQTNVAGGEADDFIAHITDQTGEDGFAVFAQIVTQSADNNALRFTNAKLHAMDMAELEPDMAFRAYYDDLLSPDTGVPLRTLVDPNDLPPGTVFNLKGHEAWIDLDDQFTMRLWIDDEAFPVEAINLIPVDNKTLRVPHVEGDTDTVASGLRGPIHDVHPTVQRRAQTVNRAEEILTQQRKVRDGLAESVEKLQRDYFPQVWNVAKIEANRAGFIDDLADALYRSNRHINGEFVAPDQAPLNVTVIQEMMADAAVDNSALQQAILRNTGEPTLGASTDTGLSGRSASRTLADDIDGLVESDLPPDLLGAYRERLDAFYRGNADTVANRLTDPIDNHGVGDAMRGDPTMARAMRIAQTDMSQWLEKDIEMILEKYARSVGGRWAVSRAIQSNPDTANMRLQSGELVRTGPQLKQYLNETFTVMRRVARTTDGQKGTRHTDAVDALRNRVENDLYTGLDLLEGRRPINYPQQYKALGWGIDRAVEVSMMNKLGSVALAQINDATPLLMAAMLRPVSTLRLSKSLLAMNKMTKQHLQLMGLWADEVARTRALSEIDNIPIGRGVGTGRTQRITAQIERGSRAANDAFGSLSLMNLMTNGGKRLAGMVEDHANLQDARRLLRASSFMDGGMDEAAALRKAGLSRTRAAKLNKLGLNRQRAQLLTDLTYQHGKTLDGQPIRSQMSMDDFLRSKDIAIPNIPEWDMDNPAIRELYQTYSGNMAALVHRNRIVSPGPFDRPNINLAPWGRAFNQFQAFGMSFVNQRLRPMAQAPAHRQLAYLAFYLGLGAVSDAISNHMSGRRSLDQTAELWQENPAGMTYAAWDRSGLSGWLARPVAVADQINLPFAPGNLLGHTPESSAARHMGPGGTLSMVLGPVASDFDRAGRAAVDVLAGDPDASTGFNATKLIPGQNLIWLRTLNSIHRGIRGDDAFQLAPEQFIRDRFEDREPAP